MPRCCDGPPDLPRRAGYDSLLNVMLQHGMKAAAPRNAEKAGTALGTPR
jgi:hypothetical protein